MKATNTQHKTSQNTWFHVGGFIFLSSFLSVTVVGVPFNPFNVVHIHLEFGHVYRKHCGCYHPGPADFHKSKMLKLPPAVKSPFQVDQVVNEGTQGWKGDFC